MVVGSSVVVGAWVVVRGLVVVGNSVVVGRPVVVGDPVVVGSAVVVGILVVVGGTKRRRLVFQCKMFCSYNHIVLIYRYLLYMAVLCSLLSDHLYTRYNEKTMGRALVCFTITINTKNHVQWFLTIM